MVKKVSSRFFGVMAKIAAVLTFALIAFIYFYTVFHGSFIPYEIYDILVLTKNYAVLSSLGLVTLEVGSKFGLFTFIISVLLVAAVIVISFFPSVASTLMAYIPT